jgi:hypothetical protein
MGSRSSPRSSRGTAETIRGYGNKLATGLAADPHPLAPLKLHYLRWVLFDNDTRFIYQGIFDTDFDKYTEDAIALFGKAGINRSGRNTQSRLVVDASPSSISRSSRTSRRSRGTRCNSRE